MSGQARTDESEPLLRGQQNGYSSNGAIPTNSQEGDTPEESDNHAGPDAEDVASQIESIKENLPFRVVVISVASLCSCLFVVAVDGTLFVTILNDVGTAFSASDLSFWVGTSYMLAMIIVAPIYGRLNNIVGRKNALICAVSLFLFGTSLCAIAPSMLALIAARAVAGLGGGGVQTCFAVMLGDLVTLRKRALYQAMAQVVFSLGNSAGGPIGGLLNDLLGWRMAIATQVPILASALLLIIFFLRLPEFPKTAVEEERMVQESGKSTLQVVRSRLDLIGCALLTVVCLTLMLALSFLSASDLPFSNVKVWANFLASALSLVLLIWYEAYIAKEPIIPLSLLKKPIIGGAVVYYLFSSVALSTIFYFPVFFRSVLLQTASQTGVHFLSLTVSTTIGAFFAGALLARSSRYKFFLVFCSAISLFPPIYLATWSNSNPPSTIGQNFALVPMGFGLSAISSITVVTVLAASQRDSHAVSLGLLYLARSLGSILGIAIFGAQMQSTLTSELTKHITGENAKEIVDMVRRNANVVASLPDDIKEIALRAYSTAFQVMNICITAILFLCLLITISIREVPLDNKSPSVVQPSENAATPPPHEATASTHGDSA